MQVRSQKVMKVMMEMGNLTLFCDAMGNGSSCHYPGRGLFDACAFSQKLRRAQALSCRSPQGRRPCHAEIRKDEGRGHDPPKFNTCQITPSGIKGFPHNEWSGIDDSQRDGSIRSLARLPSSGIKGFPHNEWSGIDDFQRGRSIRSLVRRTGSCRVRGICRVAPEAPRGCLVPRYVPGP